jgi:hypothetical protein
MADRLIGEFAQKTKSELKSFRQYLAAKDVAEDYARPYMNQAIRYQRLYDGVLPPEMNGTFSKVMLNTAFAMVQNEIPRATKAFTSRDFFNLDAKSPELEEASESAKNWLRYQMNNVQQVQKNWVAPIQSSYICGNGYMVYGHNYKKKIKTARVPSGVSMGIPYGFVDEEQEDGIESIISGQFTHFFSVFPMPGGGEVNQKDCYSSTAVDGVIWVDYMTEQKIKDNVERHGWHKRQAELMFKALGSNGNDPSNEYLSQLPDYARGAMGDPQWMSQIRSGKKDLSHRYRIAWYFQRNKWIVVGEDQFVLYDGKPLVDAIPIANFRPIPELGQWFGRSIIGVAEDIIISTMQLFNSRMDYNAKTMHPTTYVPKKLLDYHDGNKSVFDSKPYQVIDYPNTLDIKAQLFHDRYPELPQQAFIEEGTLNQQLQKVTGQPDFMSGQASGGQADGTATGVTSLVANGTARSMMRSINLENSGIHDALWLTLTYGKKYYDTDSYIRMLGEGGSPWHEIAADTITNGYGINITGSRQMNMQEETYRKMLSLAQFVIGNEAVEDQKGVMKDYMEAAGWENAEERVGAGGGGLPDASQQPTDQGQGPIQNEIRSVNNRNQVEGNTGDVVAAGANVV